MSFAGFPSRAQATAVPNVFLTDVLPALADDAPAVVVALFALRALQEKRGFPRYVTAADLRADAALAACLDRAGAAPDAVARGLDRLVDAGALLRLSMQEKDGVRELYFLNAPADRRGMEAVRAAGAPAPDAPSETTRGRAGVFALYESLIGTVSPLVAEELVEAERLYPAEWLEAAFREAAAQNARSWRYVSRILERWVREGRDEKAERDPAGAERYLAGKYGRIIRRRLGG